MYSRLARNTLLSANRVAPRPLTVAIALNPHGLRSISVRPVLGASSPYEDRPPYEARGTHPPFKPSLDYFVEAMIDLNNFRDLLTRFKAAHQDNDGDLMKAIANTLIYEVSMFSYGKERAVYPALVRHGFEVLADDSRRQLRRCLDEFMELDSRNNSSDIDTLAESVNNACHALFEYVEEREKEQYEKLLISLTGPERAELASTYLNARLQAPKYLRSNDTVAQQLISTIVKPMDEGRRKLQTFADVKYIHSDPTLA